MTDYRNLESLWYFSNITYKMHFFVFYGTPCSSETSLITVSWDENERLYCRLSNWHTGKINAGGEVKKIEEYISQKIHF